MLTDPITSDATLDGHARGTRGKALRCASAIAAIAWFSASVSAMPVESASSHPAHVQHGDDELERDLMRAAVELTNYDFATAYRSYTALLASLSIADPAGQEAAFGAAMSAQHITPAEPRLIDEARGLLENLVVSTPSSRFAPRATMALARLCELRDYAGDEVDLEGARRHYEQVIERWPREAIADEAALRLASTYIQQFEDPASIQRGVEMMTQWLDERPDNTLAAGMWEYLGATYLHYLDQPEQALRCYRRADDIGLTNPITSGKLYWTMAQIAQLSDDPDTAIIYYQKIIVQTPKSGRAYEAQQALQQMAQDHPEREIVIPQIQTFHSNEMDGSTHDAAAVEPQPSQDQGSR